MSTQGSRATAIGLTVMGLSVSAGIYFSDDGFGLLLSFTGFLTGANLVTMSARAVAAFVHRNAAAVGLAMASCAVTVVSGVETEPVLCFAMFALLLLGVSLINVGARGK